MKFEVRIQKRMLKAQAIFAGLPAKEEEEVSYIVGVLLSGWYKFPANGIIRTTESSLYYPGSSIWKRFSSSHAPATSAL